jgi:WD40 repeat protein
LYKRKLYALISVVLAIIMLASCDFPFKPVPTVMMTAAPTFTVIPTQIPASTSVPTLPPCDVSFLPLGFWPDNSHFLGQLISYYQPAVSQLLVLDLATPRTEKILEIPLGSATQMVWSFLTPERSLVAIPLSDNSIQLFDLDGNHVLATLAGHTDVVTAVVFSPTDDRVYSGSMDNSIRVWDLSGRQLYTFQPDGADNLPSQIAGLGISPDGTQLITLPAEGWIKAWDTTGYHKLREYQGSIFGAYNGARAVFSPDGRYLAVGLAAGPGDVSLWRVGDGELLWQGGFMAFAFSPDGRFLGRTEIGTGDEFSEQVVISSVDGQDNILSFSKPYANPVAAMFFSSDSLELALTLGNSETQFWRVGDSRLVYTYRPTCSK